MKIYAVGEIGFGIFCILGDKVYPSYAKALAAYPEYVKYGKDADDLEIESFEVSE